MAHGAPDHVLMVDINVLGYVDHYFLDVWEDIPIASPYDIVEVSGQGCVGATAFHSEASSTMLMVYIDGNLAFRLSPYDCFAWYGLGGRNQIGLCGCSMFDTVNSKYSLWFNPEYRLVYHKTLKVTLFNDAPGITRVRNVISYWKEKA